MIVIWKERITVNHNKEEWLLNRIDEYDRIMNMIWKERMTVNHNDIEWLLNRIDDNDWCDMKRAYECQS